MFRLFVFFTILLVGNTLRANRVEDSLLTLVKTTKNDTVKLECYRKLSGISLRSDPYKALAFINEGLELAQNIGFRHAVGVLQMRKGVIYRELDDLDNSIKCLLLAIENILTGKRDKGSDLASAYGLLGGVYQRKSLTAEKIHYQSKALEYYQKAGEIFERLGDKNGIAGIHVERAIIFHDSKRYGQAIDEYKIALRLAEEMQLKYGLSTIYGNMGNTYSNMKAYAKADEHLRRSMQISLEIGDTINAGDRMVSLASNLQNQKKNPEEVEKLALRAQAIGQRSHSPGLVLASASILSSLYRSQRRFEECVNYMEISRQYSDTLHAHSESKSIYELEARFQNSLKKNEIELLNRENALQKKETEKETFQKLVFASGFALMVVLAVIVLNGYRRKQRDNMIIARQKTIVEEQKKEIVDSIHYARRIQLAQIPSEKQIATLIKKLKK